MKKDLINSSGDKVIQLIWKSFETHTYDDLEDVVNAGKWFLQLLKLDNLQTDKLVDITKDALQKALNEQTNWKKIINQEIAWYSLYKLPNNRTKHVTFSIINNIVNTFCTELHDSPADIKRIQNLNDDLDATRQHGRIDKTPDRLYSAVSK